MPEPTSPPDLPTSPPLVCFGNLTLDDIVQPDGTEQPLCIGGDALYGVLAARLWQPMAEMVAPVGHDLPARIRAVISAAHLSQDGLPQRECPTLRNRVVYETQDRRIVTLLSDEADFETLSPRAVDVPERFWGARAFMILAMTLGAQQDLVTACRARGNGVIALDPQEEYVDGNEEAIHDLVARVDVFTPSLDEVRRLLGHGNPSHAARTFAALGPRIVVIKMGAQGCLVHDAASGRDFTMPAYPAVPVDTTGGGDAFCSAFLASLLDEPNDLERAAAAGAVSAAFAIASYGTTGLMRAVPGHAGDLVAARLRWKSGCPAPPPRDNASLARPVRGAPANGAGDTADGRPPESPGPVPDLRHPHVAAPGAAADGRARPAGAGTGQPPALDRATTTAPSSRTPSRPTGR